MTDVTQKGAVALPTSAEIEANYRLCEEEWREGNAVVAAFPRTITIETTSVCNLDCVMCNHGLEKDPGLYHHFQPTLVDKLQDIIPYAKYVQLHGSGEPLMNPDFWKILSFTNDGQHVSINSNGLLVNEKNTVKILDSPLTEINFSLDAATKETYRKIRGADFERTLKNIGHFVKERNRLKRSKPLVHINMTLMRENIEEAPAFIRLAKDLGVEKAIIWHMNTIAPDRDWKVERNGWTFDYMKQHCRNYPALSNRMVREAVALANELGIELELDSAKPMFLDEGNTSSASEAETNPVTVSVEDKPSTDADASSTHQDTFEPRDCMSPWQWALIQQEGGVLSCCYGSYTPLGNLNTSSPLQIWNGRGYRRQRKNIVANQVDIACAGGTCKFINGRPATEGFENPIWLKLVKISEKIYIKIKITARKALGETAWSGLRSVFRKTVSIGLRLLDPLTLLVAIGLKKAPTERAREFALIKRHIESQPGYDGAKKLTRDDVVSGFKILLRREPESDETIGHHLGGSQTVGELYELVLYSQEFHKLFSNNAELYTSGKFLK